MPSESTVLGHPIIERRHSVEIVRNPRFLNIPTPQLNGNDTVQGLKRRYSMPLFRSSGIDGPQIISARHRRVINTWFKQDSAASRKDKSHAQRILRLWREERTGGAMDSGNITLSNGQDLATSYPWIAQHLGRQTNPYLQHWSVI